MKTAIVYDRVNKWGGAERVLLSLHKLFPDAPLYTSVYDADGASWAKVFPKVIPSFLQYIPFAKKHHEFFPFLMPLVFESFDFSDYDLVITVTSEFAKGIITGPATKHMCICLTPTRYLWSGYEEYFRNKILKFITKPIVSYLRQWDKISAQRPDTLIAISSEVKTRIKRYYDLEAELVFPPVTLQNGKSSKNKLNLKDYFLVVGRLVPYKKVDLVVEVFNELNLPLVVIGKGSEEKRLKKLAKKNIIFPAKDLVSDDELIAYYQHCKAFIFPQVEDFGLTSVEAQLFGKPVIAYKAAGALDIVQEKKNGMFFDKQNKYALINTLKTFNKIKFDDKLIKETTKRFSENKFHQQILKLVYDR